MQRQDSLEHALVANARRRNSVGAVLQYNGGIARMGEIPARNETPFVAIFHDVRTEQAKWVAIFGAQEQGDVAIKFA